MEVKLVTLGVTWTKYFAQAPQKEVLILVHGLMVQSINVGNCGAKSMRLLGALHLQGEAQRGLNSGVHLISPFYSVHGQAHEMDLFTVKVASSFQLAPISLESASQAIPDLFFSVHSKAHNHKPTVTGESVFNK